MRLFSYSITFATLLCLVHGTPLDEPVLIKKLKVTTQPLHYSSSTLTKRSDSNYTKVEQTGYFHGSGYYSEVYVGEPPKKFNVILDTGSSDFWLMSETCNKPYCKNHNRFIPDDSKSFRRVENATIQINYGTGSILAGVGQDSVRIGGMKVVEQFVSDATTLSSEFKSLPIDGILGLGLNNLSKTVGKKHSFVENMVQQKLIEKAMFGIYTQPAGGEIDFGGTDPKRYVGNILYTPVTNRNYWQTDMKTFTFGKHKSGYRELIVDTGTTLLVVTPEDARNIHKEIKGAKANGDGTYTIPCTMKGKAPTLDLTLKGHPLSVSSEDYILHPSGKNKTMCISGISGQEMRRQNKWILGSVFLKSYYTVLDYDKMRIGFAKAVIDPNLSFERYDNK